MVIIELIAVFMTILSVLFAKKNKIWTYPIGLMSSVIYSYLTYISSFYGNFIINIYYIIMNIYGWFLWKEKKDKKETLFISFCQKKDYLYTLILFLITCTLSIIIFSIKNKKWIYYGMNWADILITGLFFSGMYQMVLKKVENWIFWMIGNALSIPVFFFKGLILTGILFFILLLLAIEGYFFWKKQARILLNLEKKGS